MGKQGGFLEYYRELPADRPVAERLKDWQEFHLHYPAGKCREQGARCMECGTPFCHTGLTIAGAASGCPVYNLIPEWNDLVYRGLWQKALERLHMTNNFPEFTGRVCPAPCEGACVLGIIEPPVTIKAIEQAIADRGFEEGWILPRPPAGRSGKKVAVVGSGPAGLACAAQLNKAWHQVTVFERADRVGGLLMYGIPNMKLDKAFVQRRADLLAAEGVEFVTGVEVGRDRSLAQLQADFDAVVLCCGATAPRDLPIPGRQLQGVHFAMDYLTHNTRRLLDGTPLEIDAAGKQVVVIGGGDTGTDCVATALRQGCQSVVQLEIMPRPPQKRAVNNPWPQWPRVYRLDYGQEEAKATCGADPRQYLVTADEFLGDDQGRVKQLRVHDIEWLEEGGRLQAKKVHGTERVIGAELVLLAMGFLGPEATVTTGVEVDRDGRSNLLADYGSFATSVPGLFAAGDARRGQSLVVWAINEGRAAAREVDRYLMGRSDLP
ncbi:glutamate synthase subunit beta [Desulfuromonas carbonis]|uniref:glutamate synthase subunit beta n=1 Tax=Desulfuromonas sp. DDH964 TaxID=1823759 RepID=UPI00078C037C|nr:glutamate synthase subunit beta [Desulfuromonas sp. DDH964]AMV73269.1 dihydropyrimidine dehydrogenase subunit A [Desulfuromonas sp. DDH964]